MKLFYSKLEDFLEFQFPLEVDDLMRAGLQRYAI